MLNFAEGFLCFIPQDYYKIIIIRFIPQANAICQSFYSLFEISWV